MDTFLGEIQKKKPWLEEKNLYEKFQALIFLKAIDEAWVEQVDFLEQLKTVVQDRNVAQHKIEYEYRKEAYYSFLEMKSSINRKVVRLLSLSNVETKEDGSLVIQYA
jgi:preprotein translocase subunit SecA